MAVNTVAIAVGDVSPSRPLPRLPLVLLGCRAAWSSYLLPILRESPSLQKPEKGHHVRTTGGAGVSSYRGKCGGGLRMRTSHIFLLLLVRNVLQNIFVSVGLALSWFATTPPTSHPVSSLKTDLVLVPDSRCKHVACLLLQQGASSWYIDFSFFHPDH